MGKTTGSPRSFDRLAAELSPQLTHYLQRMVGEPQLAEDLLQETLLRIARGLPGFRGESSVKTWAFSIATRVAADHFRKPETRANIVEVEDGGAVPDLGPDVDERVVIDEMNSCVRGVIDSLPADYRAALVLHDLQGLTAAETAAACDCSLATAKIRIHRARKRLRQALEKECTFYQDRDNVLRCDRKRPAGR
jgi:RNA polymerase sigma-70 factor (ECF subfamily)